MGAGDIETFHQGGIWFNRIEGESRTLGPSFDDQAAAVAAGHEAAVARQVEHSVKRDEGPSDDRNRYGTNPRDLIG